MTLNDIIALAAYHAKRTGNSSATLRMFDAQSLYERGTVDKYARKAAIDSLKHSIGILHEDYKRAMGDEHVESS